MNKTGTQPLFLQFEKIIAFKRSSLSNCLMNQSIACVILGGLDGILVSAIIALYSAATRKIRNAKNRDGKTYLAIFGGYIVIFLSLFAAFEIAMAGVDYFGLASKQTDNFPWGCPR